MNFLIITEKPSVQRKFVKFLLDRIIKVEKYRKAKAYVGYRKKDILIICSLAGHIVNLDLPDRDYWKYPYFPSEDKLIWVLVKGKKDYLELLKKIKRKYKIDYIVVATDLDREGSWLAAEVLEYVFGIKPPYKHPKVKRMYFSAITKSEIVRAFENLGEFDYNRALAGRARAILDLEVGANITRALTKATNIGLLSSGRVQGPTLLEIYEREKKIEEFKAKYYYQIKIIVNVFGKEIELTSDKIDSELRAKKILNKIKNYVKIRIDSEIINRKPNPPFNLTDLQSEAFRLFKISPQKTKKIAQKLYEAGIISYPRTSATKWKEKYKTLSYFNNVILESIRPTFPKLYEIVKRNLRWPPYEGSKEDDAHPPIHPVGVPSRISGEFLKIYELIVRRTLATLMPDAKVKRVVLTTSVEEIKFSKEFNKVIFYGWMLVYGKYISIPKDDVFFKPGEYFCKVLKKKVVKKKEKPPERYSPSSIIKWMESNNLGTKSTRDEILKKLYDRRYIIGSRKIRITDLGKAVVESLKENVPEILDKNLTAEIEKKLDMVEKGKISYKEVIREYIEKFKKILSEFKKKEDIIGKEIRNKVKLNFKK